MDANKPKIKYIQDVVRRPVQATKSPKANQDNRFLRRIKSSKRAALLTLLSAVTVGLGVSGYVNFKTNSTKLDIARNTIVQPTDQRISIPVYYPQNLPNGYSYNSDAKVLETNVFYFSVTGPHKQLFYITQQSIPVSFDFVNFNKKFLTPVSFNADAGAVTAGQVGMNTIGSIKTNKNTWILINSATADSLTQLETIARSLKLNQ